MSELTVAQEKFDTVDSRMKKLVVAFVIFLMLMVAFLVYETVVIQSTIVKNQAMNAQASADRFKKYTAVNEMQHQVTQKYVRCIAQVLLEPVQDRTDAVFDVCSKQ